VGAQDGIHPVRWLTASSFPQQPASTIFLNSPGVANDINESGNIAAVSGNIAFFWPSSINSLEFIAGNSSAMSINELNIVVGWTNSAMSRRAFIWSAITGYQDLNSILDATGDDWLLLEAQAINDHGEIVGVGINPDGNSHAFLLTPIPEPNTIFSLMCFAFMCIIVINWKKRNSINVAPAGLSQLAS